MGLMPARMPAGETIPAVTIQERMRLYKVPNVSVVVLDRGEIVLEKSYGQLEVKGVACSSENRCLSRRGAPRRKDHFAHASLPYGRHQL